MLFAIWNLKNTRASFYSARKSNSYVPYEVKASLFYNENCYEMVETWFSGCIIAILSTF